MPQEHHCILGYLLEAEGCQDVTVPEAIRFSSERVSSLPRSTVTNSHKLGILQENEPLTILKV